MQKRKQKTKYLLPVTLAVILVVSLVFGIFLMRNFLMRLTVEERSNQLEEMVTQIQENLTNGLQTHWNLVEGLNNATQGHILKTHRNYVIISLFWRRYSAPICMEAV